MKTRNKMLIIQEKENGVGKIILNRPEKHNALNEPLIQELTCAINTFIQDPTIHLILLKGQGKHFSVGADLTWIQHLTTLSYDESKNDALKLADLLSTLYHSPKPTLAQVQGKSYGGGIGLIAACDIVVAAQEAQFCFSEVKLGLIPAVISPYIIQAIGARTAQYLFMSATPFSAKEAQDYGLIQYCVASTLLDQTVSELSTNLLHGTPAALQACKKMVRQIQGRLIDQDLNTYTAQWLAERCQSPDTQTAIKTFLSTRKSND